MMTPESIDFTCDERNELVRILAKSLEDVRMEAHRVQIHTPEAREAYRREEILLALIGKLASDRSPAETSSIDVVL